MSIWGFIFAATLTLIACATAFVWWRFTYWRRRGIPYVKPTFPFGNTKDALLGRLPYAIAMHEIYQKVEDLPYAGLFKSLQPVLLVTDLDIIKDVMVRCALSHFVDRVPQPDTKRDAIFSKNLFTAKSAHWRILRASLSPAFSSGKMKMIFPFLREKSRTLIEKLDKIASQEDTTVDMKLNFARLTTDFIASSAFGIETNSLNDPDNEFLKMGLKIVERTPRRYFDTVIVFQFPSLLKFTRSCFLVKEVEDFFRHLVWGVVNEREEKGLKRGDFLDLLIQLKNKGKIQADDEENNDQVVGESNPKLRDYFDGDDLVAHAFVFYFAGYETSSTAMNFALLELAANQDCQEKLIEDIDKTLEENGEITYEALHSMKYLDMVVSETLRKYPTLAILDRVCNKEYRNEKYNLVIPKGMEVLIPVYSIQRNPLYYPDPEKFDPERFSEEAKLRKTNYTYMPFGEGPRFCIGMRLGLMQTKMGIFSVLSKFRFYLPKELEGMKSPPLDKRSFLVAPEDNLRLIVKRRNSTNLKAQPMDENVSKDFCNAFTKDTCQMDSSRDIR